LSELYQRAREARIGEGDGHNTSLTTCEFREELVAVKVEKNLALQELNNIDMALFEVKNKPLWQGIAGLFSRLY